MRIIFAYITVGLLKAAHFTANTSAGKYYARVALDYEWDMRR